VGITGTNGKTTTTRFVAAALGALARPVASVTTIGSFLDEEPFAASADYRGLIETVKAGLERGGRYTALESTSEALALGFAQHWPFRAGVFTNLTHDHLDAHGSPEHYFASKAQLFHSLPEERGVAVLNASDEASELLVEVIPPGVRRVAYSVASRGEACLAPDARATRVELSWSGTNLEVELSPELGGGTVSLRTRAIGEIFAENALAAFVTGLALGASREAAAGAIGRATRPSGRFELVAERPYVAVDYAHTPDALRRTLETAVRLARGKVVVVFGAGGNRDQTKRPAMGVAAGAAARVILTSDNPRGEDPAAIAAAIREGIPPSAETLVELDRERAIQRAVLDAAAEDVIVIAGKGHETTQTIGAAARPFSDGEVARRAHAERSG
jgi:UDP-N-acetylmuramoyl-L-alanyl-D-glutamate--2,6-diaminopimelate ligase